METNAVILVSIDWGATSMEPVLYGVFALWAIFGLLFSAFAWGCVRRKFLVFLLVFGLGVRLAGATAATDETLQAILAKLDQVGVDQWGNDLIYFTWDSNSKLYEIHDRLGLLLTNTASIVGAVATNTSSIVGAVSTNTSSIVSAVSTNTSSIVSALSTNTSSIIAALENLTITNIVSGSTNGVWTRDDIDTLLSHAEYLMPMQEDMFAMYDEFVDFRVFDYFDANRINQNLLTNLIGSVDNGFVDLAGAVTNTGGGGATPEEMETSFGSALGGVFSNFLSAAMPAAGWGSSTGIVVRYAEDQWAVLSNQTGSVTQSVETNVYAGVTNWVDPVMSENESYMQYSNFVGDVDSAAAVTNFVPDFSDRFTDVEWSISIAQNFDWSWDLGDLDFGLFTFPAVTLGADFDEPAWAGVKTMMGYTRALLTAAIVFWAGAVMVKIVSGG